VLTPPYVGTVGLVHAAMRIGATFVPLGQELTERELTERVERADLDAVVCAEPTEGAALGAVEECEGATRSRFSVDDPAAEAVTAVHSVDPGPVEPPEWATTDYLCILFTSGTTGDPKPVPLTAGNVYSSAVASAFRLGVDHEDRWLVSLSLHHMGGLAPVYRSALYGTTLVLQEGSARAAPPTTSTPTTCRNLAGSDDATTDARSARNPLGHAPGGVAGWSARTGRADRALSRLLDPGVPDLRDDRVGLTSRPRRPDRRKDGSAPSVDPSSAPT